MASEDDTPPSQSPIGALTERIEQDAARLYDEPLLTPQQRKAERKAAYVELIASGCSHSEAAEGVGVDRATAWRWRQNDPEFARACGEALKVNIETLKREAERRAIRGSDKLLMFLLERYDPSQFHLAQKLEHSGTVDLASAVIAARRRAGAEDEPGADLC